MIEVGGNSGTWFEFYGWRPVPPCLPPSVVPWVWAEVLTCLVYNMLGIRPEKDVIVIRPKILNLTNEIESKFTIAGKEVNIKISSSSKVKVSYALLNEKKKLNFKNGQIKIPKSLNKINLEIYLKGK
jgi:cellobiose phosphorylase